MDLFLIVFFAVWLAVSMQNFEPGMISVVIGAVTCLIVAVAAIYFLYTLFPSEVSRALVWATWGCIYYKWQTRCNHSLPPPRLTAL